MELNLIRKIAWTYSKTTQINFDDLFSEACIAYLKAQSKYNPDQGIKESTFLWSAMKNHLNSIIPKYKGLETVQKHSGDSIEWKTPLDSLLIKDQIKSLSKEAQMVCKMIFESPHEFLVLNKPKLSRGRVKDHLRETGWSWSKIWGTFREIKNTLSEMGC